MLSGCPVHLCFSLLITSFHKSGSKGKKKTYRHLELHIKKNYDYIFSFFWSELNIKCCQVLFLKIRKYKVIRTLDTNIKK